MVQTSKLTTNTAIERFMASCHRRRFPAKSTIIYADDKPNSLYYIASGSVAVMIEEEDGHEIVLSYLNSGDFFGEMGLFNPDTMRSAWVNARSECELYEINYDDFRLMAKDHPEVLFELSSQMAVRLRRTSGMVGRLAFMDVAGRIARTLLDLCKEPDAITHPDGMMVKITRQELGRIVGCSREMAGRVLKNLEAQNLISAKGKSIVVFGTR